MFFKSSNYSILDHTVDPFDIIHETDKKIQAVSVTPEGEIFYTQENFLYKHKTTKKNKSQDEIVKLKVEGNLVICGDIKGCVKIFSKNILIRSYNEHTNKINGLELYDNKILISGSDDATIKFYNVVESKSFKTFDWLGDRVKCLKIFEDILYIGLMNGILYGVDLKSYEKVYEFDTKQEIFNLDIHDKIIFYTSSNKIYRLDKNIKHLGSHTKQITSIKVLDKKIYTISLDGYFKTWSVDGQLISKIYFSSPILSFDKFDKIFYFGLEVGKLCQLGGSPVYEKKKIIKNRNIKDYEEEIQYKLLEQNIIKNTSIEKLILKFEHKGALKKALDGNNFKDIFAVLYYLHQDRKLKNAIIFLEKEYVMSLLDFTAENLQIAVLFEILHEVLSILLSVYLEDFTDDSDFYDRLVYLSELVDEECLFQEKLIEVYSFLECFE